MNFKTFGPFQLDDWSKSDVDALYLKFRKIDKNLENAVGVYVVYVAEEGKQIPWYVGKTDSGFGNRLKQHFNHVVFEEAFRKFGNLSLFLIARTTPKGKFIKQRKGRKLDSIDKLEFLLIGTCLAQNPELRNDKLRKFHQRFVVPGYMNSPRIDRDASAKKLAKLLGTRG